MNRARALSTLAAIFVVAWPLAVPADISGKAVVVFKIDRNIVTSTLVVRGDRVTIERRYQKPYQGGGKGVGFRKVDRAVYAFDCSARQVALQRFAVILPREKTVYQAETLNWRPATGPEFAAVFEDHCGVSLSDSETPLQPDKWLTDGPKTSALSSGSSDRIESLTDALPLNRAAGRMTIGPATDVEQGLRQVSVALDYADDVALIETLSSIQRLELRVLVDCESRRAIVANARFLGRQKPVDTAFPTDNIDEPPFWLSVPKTGSIAEIYQSAC